jgi:two-component system chemotaxis response regulator CheB
MSGPTPVVLPIRVLVADDSIFMRTALTRMIESDPALKVVGTAANGLEALEKAALLDPDVVTLDLEMPRMDGLRALQRLMEESPRPVIVVSSLSQEGAEVVLEAFDHGAFECIGKPTAAGHLDIVRIREDLVAKVKAAALSRHTLRKPKPSRPAQLRAAQSEVQPLPKVVAIGSSTGGPNALQEILSRLPGSFPAGILLVQHMPRGFTGPFARRLDSLSKLTVREAVDDDFVEPGVALLAPAGRHMTVYRRTPTRVAVRLSDSPADALHVPSVDVMMQAVAEVFGVQAMGVILTGMGSDGLRGMREIYARGGYTIGQDEASCVVYGMPRACAEAGILRRVRPLQELAEEIIDTVSGRLLPAEMAG